MNGAFSLDQQLAKIAQAFREPQPTITDFLKDQLDQSVDRKYSDNERLRFLAIEQGKWALRMREFYREGKQPFGGPHPEYGEMSAGDFIIVLGLIESKRVEIMARMDRERV